MRNFNDKSRSAYNKKAYNYDNTSDGRFTEKFKQLLIENIELNNCPDVLDVACGNGSLLAALNKKMPINGFGVDLADQMIKSAAEKNPGMEFHVSGCEAMPFGNDAMDIITVSAAYHHFPDVAAFAKEAARVLKHKGRIYIAEVYLPSALRFILNPFVPLSTEGDVKFYSPKEIVNNFARFGFEKVDVGMSGKIQIISMQKFEILDNKMFLYYDV